MSDERNITDVSKLIMLNNLYLDQAVDLIESVSVDVFRFTDGHVISSGIGDHIRHIIEHYQLFVAGVSHDKGEPVLCVNYDNRKRDPRLSNDPEVAIIAIREIQTHLASIPLTDTSIEVNIMSSPTEAFNAPLSLSSVGRELQYLQSHTIHHFALIALILRFQHVAVNPEFGMAPSSLKFREESTT